MALSPNPDLLVLVTVPRCASGSLAAWLAASHAHTGPDPVGEDVNAEAIVWSADRLDALADVRVRSTWSPRIRTFPPRLGNRVPRYVTILRDPVDRWVSHVRSLQRLDELGRHPAQSLREYAEWMIVQPRWSTLDLINAQANHLALFEWQSRQGEASIDWSNDGAFDKYEAARLQVALDVIDGFSMLGVVERMSECTRLLRRCCSEWSVPLTPIRQLPRRNVSPGPPSDTSWIRPSDRVGRRLLDAFADDYVLYQRAHQRLNEDLKARSSGS